MRVDNAGVGLRSGSGTWWPTPTQRSCPPPPPGPAGVVPGRHQDRLRRDGARSTSRSSPGPPPGRRTTVATDVVTNGTVRPSAPCGARREHHLLQPHGRGPLRHRQEVPGRDGAARETPLVTGATNDWQPAVSPDGSKLCFLREPQDNKADIWTANTGAADSGLAPFASDAAASNTWQPNASGRRTGTEIAFTRGAFGAGAMLKKERRTAHRLADGHHGRRQASSTATATGRSTSGPSARTARSTCPSTGSSRFRSRAPTGTSATRTTSIARSSPARQVAASSARSTTMPTPSSTRPTPTSPAPTRSRSRAATGTRTRTPPRSP